MISEELCSSTYNNSEIKMPEGKHKSKTYRKISVRTPGNNVTTHYRRKKPAKAKCGSCKKELAGVPRDIPLRVKNLPKTQKRPERPYGGVLCSACMRNLMKEKARSEK
ncbi:MAG: 50S ribosomal protein L34e [Candidatus Woesearchaeota archaeon]